MSTLTRTRVTGLGGLAAALFIAAACSSGATASPSAPPSQPPAAESPSAAASASEEPSESASASAEAEGYTVTKATATGVPTYLAGEDGKTLYTFKADTAGVSNCSGGCATAWPPFVLEGSETVKGGDGVTGTFATITRADGGKQVTYNGRPLYYYATDTKAGDVTGQGVGGKWFVAEP